jgi:hypothetical protein
VKVNRIGESKVGCLLAILLLVIAIYFGFVGIPPYYNSVQFFDESESLVTRAAVYGWPEKKVMDSLLELARKLDQPVTADNIRIAKTRNNLVVEIDYTLTLDFGFFKYGLSRNAKFSGLSGSLR